MSSLQCWLLTALPTGEGCRVRGCEAGDDRAAQDSDASFQAGAHGTVADMSFSEIELAYLSTPRLARLATVTKAGRPNLVPVSFRLNADGTIDIGSPNPNAQRYRNIRVNEYVSLVVDDMTPNDPSEVKPGWGRGVEIRGVAEILTVEDVPVAPEWFCHEIIRVHPRRIHSWHIDPANPDGSSRNVGSDS
ncbi:PPOX class F420-dependent oxidoreductase [Nocardia salmonicida]|uniref:PPOX class F420-dependent oxidoreductase n=1 Tax=Nocardia salmonicida TaxID=53431 RepID=UPI003CF935AA